MHEKLRVVYCQNQASGECVQVIRHDHPSTKPPVHYDNALQLNVPSPNNQDMLWLAERTSSRN